MVRFASLTTGLLGAAASLADATYVKRASNSSLVASTYFAGYHIDQGFTVSEIPWEKYTEVKYAFAETTANGSLDLSKSFPDQLPVFVSDAKKNGVKALVSVGGWTGSRFFSTSFGSAQNRTAFAKECMSLVTKYQLDGLDFDYEYPNKQGLGCNAINANDTANFAAFLQEFRQLPGAANLTMTAAASLFPWMNASSAQSTDLSTFGTTLDYVMIMNYDIFGRWAPTAGPNAPLASACDARNNQGSATSGVDAWLAAGLPADKIVLGIAAYGHGFRVNASSAMTNSSSLNMYPNFNSSDLFQGSSWDNDPPIDECGNTQTPGGTYPFWSMISEVGMLDEAGQPANNTVSGWDSCSQTPAVWDSKSQIWISYDDAKSVAIKGDYIMETGLGGFALWETGGDYNNILVDAVRTSVGLASTGSGGQGSTGKTPPVVSRANSKFRYL